MTQKAQHTPGPWSADNTLNRVFGADKTKAAVCGACYSAADRNLIAAAPELLAVVEELEESAGYWSEYDVPLGIVDRIRDVLKKARGEL